METKTVFQVNPVSKQVIISNLPINTTISTNTNNSHVSELFLKLICQFWSDILTPGAGSMPTDEQIDLLIEQMSTELGYTVIDNR